jgi:hypothetical protein
VDCIELHISSLCECSLQLHIAVRNVTLNILFMYCVNILLFVVYLLEKTR